MTVRNDDGHVRWANAPPAHMKGGFHKLVRMKLGQEKSGTILSHEMVGLMMHWAGAKTIACLGDHCPSCANNAETKWRGYFWLQDFKLDHPVIHEVTPVSGATLEAYFAEHRTLRGCVVKLKRNGKRYNGMVSIDIASQRADHKSLPTMPSLRPLLLQIFQVPIFDAPPFGGVVRDEVAKALAATNGHV